MTNALPPTDPEAVYKRPTGSHRIYPENEPRRGLSWGMWALIAIVVALLIAGVAVAYRIGHPRDPQTTSAGAPVVPTSPAPALAPVTPAPVEDLPEGAITGDDEHFFVVGTDLPPGKYTTAGPLDESGAGTWERRRWSSRDNSFEPVANEDSRGPATVTLRAGDLFQSRNFKPWHVAP